MTSEAFPVATGPMVPEAFPEALEDALEGFARSLDLAPLTVSAYVGHARQYLGWLRSEGRAGTGREDVLAYKAFLAEACKPSTVTAHLSAVRALYAYAEAFGVPNAASGVKSPKKARGHARDPITAGQFRAVMQGFDVGTLKGARDAAIVSLMAHTGLRCMEVAGADVGDLRALGTAMVLYVRGKGRDEKDAYVVITGAPEAAVMRYLQLRGRTGPSAPLFASTSNRNDGGRLDRRSVSVIVKDALRAAGVDSDRVTAHSLRHTAVTAALMGGASIAQAQAMARHSDPRTTMVYAHDLDRLTRPAEAAVDAALGDYRGTAQDARKGVG